MEVRRLRPDEGPRFKELRLAALKDAPDAFSSKLAQEELYDDHWWTDKAARASNDETAILVAEDGDRWAGMIGLFPDRTVEGALHVWGMWVAPDYRGRKVGGALLDAALDVASGTSATSVRLHVVITNDSATLLYERRGFTPAGDPHPFPSDNDPNLIQVEMAKDIAR